MEVNGQHNDPYVFISVETAPITHWLGGWVGFRLDLGALEKRQVAYLCPESKIVNCCVRKYEE
jgi:hypothetical protein